MSTHEEKIYKNIGKNVRKYRTLRGISQEKLSEILNVNSKFIGSEVSREILQFQEFDSPAIGGEKAVGREDEVKRLSGRR